MKKLFTTLFKVIILLFSFAAITLAILMRDQIDLPIMIATIAVATVLIIIVIILLVNEAPEQVVQAPVKQKEVQKSEPKLMITESEEKVQEKKPKKSKFKWFKLSSGDFVFTKMDVQAEMKALKKAQLEEDIEAIIEDIAEEEILAEVLLDEVIDETLIEETIIETANLLNKAIANPYSIDLQLSSHDLENLMSLMETMEHDKLITKNADFDNFDLLPRAVKYYQYNYKDIPVLTLIRQRNHRFKVMGGVETSKLYEITQLDESQYDFINKLYQSSQHMQGIISGGRYRYIDIETGEEIEKSEPLRVQVRIYHGLS